MMWKSYRKKGRRGQGRRGSLDAALAMEGMANSTTISSGRGKWRMLGSRFENRLEMKMRAAWMTSTAPTMMASQNRTRISFP